VTGRRTSPVAWVLIQPIRFYQRFVSRYTPPSCRYYPCCSSFAISALRVHGAAKGTLLTVWRLLRCNPWSSGGVDVVPPPGSWRGGDPIPQPARTAGDGVERPAAPGSSSTDLFSSAQSDPARAPIAGSTAA
jgi:putative membrane protein insertion efficiency factor